MRHNATFGHKHFVRRKKHAVIAASDLLRAFFFIVTAIIAAALITMAYQGELARIWTPPTVIETPVFGSFNTPHDDICDNIFDNLSANKNIKGYSESSIIKNDCIFRQMGNGVGLND